MPGLFGILNLHSRSVPNPETSRLFEKMAESLRHHKEDELDQAHLSDPNLSLGRISLPWQNSEKWNSQPANERLSEFIFVAGQVLEKTSVFGEDATPDPLTFQYWQGFYSAVVASPKTGTVLIVVDRRASQPIYYTQIDGQVLFAPEVKALLVHSQVSRQIDQGALATFLAQGYLLGEQTLFKSIRRLQGGELLRINREHMEVVPYWRFSPGSQIESATQADLEHELGTLLNKAVQRHLGKPDEAIIFLSGGTDSRGILGGALEQVQGDGSKLNTVSWGEDRGSKDSDVAIASMIARQLNTTHRFVQRKTEEYRERFRNVNFLMDGLSDISAFHPYEYQIMVDLRQAGFRRALRGDEVFGWSLSAASIEGAFAMANLRRLRNMQGLEAVIRVERYPELCDASDAAVDQALLEARDLRPDQAKDFFYFRHRLQCYLQTASYYKLVELDQRNVLLDEMILDFLARVPDPLRIDKILFRKVVFQNYPVFSPFPYAGRSNLENWQSLLAKDTPIRQYALDEFAHHSSGIWEYLDPSALSDVLNSLRGRDGIKSSFAKFKPKTLIKQGLKLIAPGLLTRTQAQRRARPVIQMSVDNLIMRSLVLKNWYDTFVG